MHFEKGYIYHIYNQGNNRQTIFFSSENYLFFLRKIRTYILPYGDILAWCLMPNHFHLMVFVRSTSLEVSSRHSETGKQRTFCFDYIHNNPTKAKLVKQNNDWESSPARDYANLRNGNLINKSIAIEYGLI